MVFKIFVWFFVVVVVVNSKSGSGSVSIEKCIFEQQTLEWTSL